MALAAAPTAPTVVGFKLGTGAAPATNLGGSTLNVTGDLQTFIGGVTGKVGANACLNGDGTHKGNTYVLAAGSTQNLADFTLPPTTGTGWTRFITSGTLPSTASAPGTAARRVGPAHVAQLAKIRDTGAGGAGGSMVTIFGGPSANGYIFQGIEADHLAANNLEETLEVHGDRLIVDQCYIHNHSAGTQTARPINMRGSDFQLWDSTVSEGRRVAGECQGVLIDSFAGKARGHIENNRIEAAGSNIFLGDQNSPGPATDYTILRNYLFKPLAYFPLLIDGSANGAYDGIAAPVKNSLETKHCLRVLFEGNTIENMWGGAQDGTCIVVYVGVSAGHASFDLNIQHNRIIRVGKGFSITEGDGSGGHPNPTGGARIRLYNNCFTELRDRLALFNWKCSDVWVEHNTGVPMTLTTDNAHSITFSTTTDFPNLTVRRNIIGRNQFGIFHNAVGVDGFTTAAADTHLPTRVFLENARVSDGAPALAGFTNFASAAAAGITVATGVLASNSPLKAGGANGGSDSKDIGVDFVALNAALAGTLAVPDAQFTIAQPPGALLVNFTNASSGTPFTAHQWTLYATNGTTVLSTATTANHSFTYPASGQYFVTHTVTNAQGPGTLGPVAFTVNPATSPPPTITITSPTAASTLATQSPTLVLSGTATDVTSVTWANAEGATSGVATGLNTWTTPAITLVAGLNTLTVTGFGSAPNAQDTVAVTYTPLTPVPPTLMRGFGVTRGVAATDKIVIPLTTHPTIDTHFMWVRHDGAGGGGFGRLFDGISAISHLDANTLLYIRGFSTTAGGWSFPVPPLGVRASISVRHDASNTTNVPIIKINNVVQTLGVFSAPVGTATVTAGAIVLGNRLTPDDRGWVGDIAKWLRYNRILSDAEEVILIEGGNPMTLGGGAPVAYHKLDGTAANEPDTVTAAVSTLTGTVVQDYGAAPPPPTVTLAVTTGSPSTGTAYQITATTTGTVHRVEFTIDAGSVITRTVAPYLLFAAPQLLGPGAHTIVANVFDTPGGTTDGTATLPVTEPTPPASGAWSVTRELGDRVPTAVSYNVYLDGVFLLNQPQPATGHPVAILPFTGSDRLLAIRVHPVFTGAVEGVGMTTTIRYTDPSATAPVGLAEVARPYDGTTWTPTYRWERKPSPALSYNVYLDGTLAGNVPIPPVGRPSYQASFTGTDVTKVVGVAAVYAGPVDGPRASVTYHYLAPVTNAMTGGQDLSRTFTP